ncbi:hypothetical protein [Methanolapillus ohkumae]|uniref:hypothetical protein n=1 Tax=Methanolapillus ohkumae TaxID=3028298 RepID=UPI0030B8AF13
MLRKIKIEIEGDWSYLEIQVPVAEKTIALNVALEDELNGLCEEAQKAYGNTANCFFLITRYENY